MFYLDPAATAPFTAFPPVTDYAPQTTQSPYSIAALPAWPIWNRRRVRRAAPAALFCGILKTWTTPKNQPRATPRRSFST